MIKIDRLAVYGINSAIIGMRNPLNSRQKSDTIGDQIGPDDMRLLQQLTKAGPDHRKVLRQMFISFDVTAPLYWYKEFDQYKIGVTTNSTSTMHKIASRCLTRDDFSFEDMHDDEFIVNVVLDNLNARIKDYQVTKNKNLWRTIIQLLPSSYNQTRTVTMSYENMLNIYKQRRYHKLSEWQEFCAYMYDNLPYLQELLSVI